MIKSGASGWMRPTSQLDARTIERSDRLWAVFGVVLMRLRLKIGISNL